MQEEETELKELDIKNIGPKVVKSGSDLTIVGTGFTSCQALEAGKELEKNNGKKIQWNSKEGKLEL